MKKIFVVWINIFSQLSNLIFSSLYFLCDKLCVSVLDLYSWIHLDFLLGIVLNSKVFLVIIFGIFFSIFCNCPFEIPFYLIFLENNFVIHFC